MNHQKMIMNTKRANNSYTTNQGPIYWKIPPVGGGGISADVIWGKKYDKAKRKRGKSIRKRKKGERK
jgi:hypothetical protein